MTRSIQSIDKEIDAVRAALLRRRPVENPLSTTDWQSAWDAEPQLAARNKALWGERGEAQLDRAQREHEATRALKRVPSKVKRCPACGSRAA